MLELLKSRQSAREYNNTPLEEEKLMQVLEAARMAPSGKNAQPWQFIVVKDVNTRQKLAQADHNQQWMMQAPVMIVCVADAAAHAQQELTFVDEDTADMGLKRAIRDTSIAIDHMMLQAESMALATCWTGWYLQKDVRPILQIPEDQFVVGILTLGYSDTPKRPKNRKDLREIVRYEKW